MRSMKMTDEELLTALARKARELNEGMQERVKRPPDIADFRCAFEPILKVWKNSQ